MPATARVGDRGSGTCCCHPPAPCIGVGFTIVSGSPSTQVDGKPVAREGDSIVGDCGHSGKITSGSGISQADGKPIARVGDSVGGGCIVSGTITSGSPTDSTD
jgi:uncharacterized Zn-binding protein involved in type VI secretion